MIFLFIVIIKTLKTPFSSSFCCFTIRSVIKQAQMRTTENYARNVKQTPVNWLKKEENAVIKGEKKKETALHNN